MNDSTISRGGWGMATVVALVSATLCAACEEVEPELFSTKVFESDPRFFDEGNRFRGKRSIGSRCDSDQDCYLPLCLGGVENYPGEVVDETHPSYDATVADEIELFAGPIFDGEGVYKGSVPQGYCTAPCEKFACRPGSTCVDPYPFQFNPEGSADRIGDLALVPPVCLRQCNNDHDCVSDFLAQDAALSAILTDDDYVSTILCDILLDDMIYCNLPPAEVIECTDDEEGATYAFSKSDFDPYCNVERRGARCMELNEPSGRYCVPLPWTEARATQSDIGGGCTPFGNYNDDIRDCKSNYCETWDPAPSQDPLNSPYEAAVCTLECTPNGCPEGSVCEAQIDGFDVLTANCRKLCDSHFDCWQGRFPKWDDGSQITYEELLGPEYACPDPDSDLNVDIDNDGEITEADCGVRDMLCRPHETLSLKYCDVVHWDFIDDPYDDLRPIGDECENHEDCWALNCFDLSADASVVRSCTTDCSRFRCPLGSQCINFGEYDDGSPVLVCLQECTMDYDCHNPEHVCGLPTLDAAVTACVPENWYPFGRPIGAACDLNVECRQFNCNTDIEFPQCVVPCDTNTGDIPCPDATACIQDAFGDGLDYCMQECGAQAPCIDGAACTPTDAFYGYYDDDDETWYFYEEATSVCY